MKLLPCLQLFRRQVQVQCQGPESKSIDLMRSDLHEDVVRAHNPRVSLKSQPLVAPIVQQQPLRWELVSLYCMQASLDKQSQVL